MTGAPAQGDQHEHHIWHVETVRALVASHQTPMTFFGGGSRNWVAFIQLFDAVFILQVDVGTLIRRLDGRADDEWGARPAERACVLRSHRAAKSAPDGMTIDATQPLASVVDEILRRAAAQTGKEPRHTALGPGGDMA